MKLLKTILLITSFGIGFIIAFITIFYNISLLTDPFILIIAGVIAYLTFIVISVNEIGRATKINRSEKIIWIIALLFLFSLAGLVYLIYSRKRIIQND